MGGTDGIWKEIEIRSHMLILCSGLFFRGQGRTLQEPQDDPSHAGVLHHGTVTIHAVEYCTTVRSLYMQWSTAPRYGHYKCSGVLLHGTVTTHAVEYCMRYGFPCSSSESWSHYARVLLPNGTVLYISDSFLMTWKKGLTRLSN